MFEYHAVIADKIEYRYIHRASICPASGMDRRGAPDSLRGAFTYRSVFLKPLCYNLWHNRLANRDLSKTVGLCPTPCKPLKRLDLNFYQNAITLRFSEKYMTMQLKIGDTLTDYRLLYTDR